MEFPSDLPVIQAEALWDNDVENELPPVFIGNDTKIMQCQTFVNRSEKA